MPIEIMEATAGMSLLGASSHDNFCLCGECRLRFDDEPFTPSNIRELDEFGSKRHSPDVQDGHRNSHENKPPRPPPRVYRFPKLSLKT